MSTAKGLRASAQSADFPFRVDNIPIIHYENATTRIEANAVRFSRTKARPCTSHQQYQWGRTDLRMPGAARGRDVVPSLAERQRHDFAQRSFKPESSELSASQIGMHHHDGARLTMLRARSDALFREAVVDTNENFKICCKTTMKLGTDPTLTYPHTYEKMLNPALHRARANAGLPGGAPPTPASRADPPAGLRDIPLLRPYRNATEREAAARSEFTSSYRARQKDHIAQGSEPRCMGDEPDAANATSMYGFGQVSSTTAGTLKRALAEDAKARARYRSHSSKSKR